LPAQPAITGDEDNEKNELEYETFHGFSPFNESLGIGIRPRLPES
jgi:hypothetical protein